MFKPVPQIDQLAVHFQLDGNLIHKDSDEGKRQLARDNEGRRTLRDAQEPCISHHRTYQRSLGHGDYETSSLRQGNSDMDRSTSIRWDHA